MPYSWQQFSREVATPEEIRKLIELRREALDHATAEGRLDGPLPVQWRVGWTAHIRTQGRDHDGSLVAHIVVQGPHGQVPYVRKVRLVRSQPLPRSLGQE